MTNQAATLIVHGATPYRCSIEKSNAIYCPNLASLVLTTGTKAIVCDDHSGLTQDHLYEVYHPMYTSCGHCGEECPTGNLSTMEQTEGFCPDCTDAVIMAQERQAAKAEQVCGEYIRLMAPALIDKVLAESYETTYRHEIDIRSKQSQVKTYRATTSRTLMSAERREARAVAIEAEIEGHRAAIKAEIERVAPYQAVYDERQWKRYYLVMGGHVHRGRTCHTCNATTYYLWLVSLADCDETAMVEKHGERACTACFPDAPTMPAYIRSLAAVEAQEQAEADALCPASGHSQGKGFQRPDGTYRWNFCPTCGTFTRPTRNGNVRKHKSGQADSQI